MAEWVANSWWGAYLADLGPYVGPLPSAPPIPANLPDTAGEIDYVIGLPDPNNATGFKNAAYLDLYRMWNGAPGASTTDAGLALGSGGAPASGAHLVVAWYWPDYGLDGIPPIDPMTLVPPSFVTGATGAPVGDPSTGKWSDEVTYLQVASPGFSGGRIDGVVANGRDADPVAAEDAAIAALTTASQDAGTFFPYQAEWGAGVSYALISEVWTAYANYDQAFATCQAQASLTAPDSPPPGLIEGLDYWAIPTGPVNGYTYADYGTPDPIAPFQYWDDIAISVGYDTAITGSPSAAYDSAEFDVAILQPAVPVGTGTPLRFDGTVAGSMTVTLGQSGTDEIQPGRISSASWTAWLRTPNMNYPAPISAAPADGNPHDITWRASVNSVGATAYYLTGPLRYWIPGPVKAKIPPYLRMNQRNDGLGIHAHPRIPIGPNRPSSIQSAQAGTGAPRIGTKNRYL